MPRKKSTTQTAEVDGQTVEIQPSADESALHTLVSPDVALSADLNHVASTKTSRKSTARSSAAKSKKAVEEVLPEASPEATQPSVPVAEAEPAADEVALDIDAPPDAPLPAELKNYVTPIKTSKNGRQLDPLKLPLLDYRPAYLSPEEKVHVLLTGLHMFSEQQPLLDNIGCRIIRTVQYHLSSPLSEYIFTEGMRPQASGELLITSRRLVFNSVSSFLTVKWEELESVDSFANALRLNIRHLRHGLVFSMQDRLQIDQASLTLSHYLNQ
ncbi:hypothetical protein [Deinococcus cellulosilyticus]|uniref:Uncharacterized protein n=1 Tax=Deinococcus cellulosilyticus (strain DSM 18568 / NBRC 106333 / KACC 11606 / 5516J-15) TaxID=1223518 RepID=A0A511N971_DEIC1|nr:hypothetical protein [Deinococcus cellulosilyticus]GEM49399.1 hypothetical protein DC3_50340 [Deinococcus cellulosilyticus NBRC 106333 = KACC 11606]